jgi:DNA-binding GntR family transcriptional regulator
MIEKIIFRKSVKDILISYMLNGNKTPNERLSLQELASEIDISVTPIREALTQLTENGIVTYRANRGFFVTALNETEAIENYRIIALLECEAVKNCVFNTNILNELKSINEKFKDATSISDSIYFDTLFHQKLIENYNNESGKKIIEDIRTKLSIYELSFMNIQSTNKSYKMHNNIINHLQNEDNIIASKELKQNWEISIHHIKNGK